MMASSAGELDLSAAIRIARIARGWSRTKLAAELGTSESLIGKWENGRTQPSMRQFRNLCLVFGWHLDTGRKLSLAGLVGSKVRSRSPVAPIPPRSFAAQH
jgi:transcriptional regulator with XRE-family HTH domain